MVQQKIQNTFDILTTNYTRLSAFQGENTVGMLNFKIKIYKAFAENAEI